MRSFLIASTLALAAAGCGDHGADKLELVRRQVCACKDVACGEAALAKVPEAKIPATHDTQEIARRMLDCMARLYDTQRPTTDPDAPAEPGSGSGSSSGSGSGSGSAP
jgi:hypothetical protein